MASKEIKTERPQEPQTTQPCDNSNNTIPYITNQSSLNAFLIRLRTSNPKRCVIDTEGNSLYGYKDKLCLIQFATEDMLAIIDPLQIEDLSPFLNILDEMEVWMHGADFDMRMLQRTYGRIPNVVYDTNIASRLLGKEKNGLANLVEEHFEIVLPKSNKLQKANWGYRPLSQKLIDYAINDVKYLLEIADSLSAQLREVKRWDWFVESCAAGRVAASTTKEKNMDTLWRISGYGSLERKGMAFLRVLWFWRDKEAELRDIPAFKILQNQELLTFSTELQGDKNVKLPYRFKQNSVKRFFKAIENVRGMELKEYPDKLKGVKVVYKGDGKEKIRSKQLKDLRDKIGKELGIDPTLISSQLTLKAVAKSPNDYGEVLLNWQQELLKPAISKFGNIATPNPPKTKKQQKKKKIDTIKSHGDDDALKPLIKCAKS